MYNLTPERWNLLNRRISVLFFRNIIIFEFWLSYSWKSMNFNFGNQFRNVGIPRDRKNSRKQVPDVSKNKLFSSRPMSRILPIILDYLYFSILALPFSSTSAVYTQRNIFSFLKNPRAATHNWRKFISARNAQKFSTNLHLRAVPLKIVLASMFFLFSTVSACVP